MFGHGQLYGVGEVAEERPGYEPAEEGVRNNNTTNKWRERNRVKGNKAEFKEKVMGENSVSTEGFTAV